MYHVLYGGSFETYIRVLYETFFILGLYYLIIYLQIQHLVDDQYFTSYFLLTCFHVIGAALEIDLTSFHKPSLRNILTYWVLVLFLLLFLLYWLHTKYLLFTFIYPVSFPYLQSPTTCSYNHSSSWTSCVFLSSLSVTRIVNPPYSAILILPVCLIYLHTFLWLHMPVLLST